MQRFLGRNPCCLWKNKKWGEWKEKRREMCASVYVTRCLGVRHTHTHTLKYQREKPPFSKTFSHTNTHLHSETAPLQYFSLRPGHTHTFTHLLTVLFCSWLVGCNCRPGADTSGDWSSISSRWPYCSPSCAHPQSLFPGTMTSAVALER